MIQTKSQFLEWATEFFIDINFNSTKKVDLLIKSNQTMSAILTWDHSQKCTNKETYWML